MAARAGDRACDASRQNRSRPPCMSNPSVESPKPLAVLIADDQPTMIRLLTVLLEVNGHRVVAAARDGIEAVELSRTSDPDLAIIDIEMPRLNGLDAAREILAERVIPIIISTGR